MEQPLIFDIDEARSHIAHLRQTVIELAYFCTTWLGPESTKAFLSSIIYDPILADEACADVLDRRRKARMRSENYG